MCALDALLLGAFVVRSAVLGRSLSYMDCFAVRAAPSGAGAGTGFLGVPSVGAGAGAGAGFVDFAGASRASCFAAKGVWGLGIASS